MTYDYDDRRKELVELSSFDESESYEVDMGAVCFSPEDGTIRLLTASGCSCWSGEFTEETFSCLTSLEESLNEGTHRKSSGEVARYSPTLAGAKVLVAEARAQVAHRLETLNRMNETMRTNLLAVSK